MRQSENEDDMSTADKSQRVDTPDVGTLQLCGIDNKGMKLFVKSFNMTATCTSYQQCSGVLWGYNKILYQVRLQDMALQWEAWDMQIIPKSHRFHKSSTRSV